MFWDVFSGLCAKNGKSPNAVASELNISSGSITAWSRGTCPRSNTVVKIAEYFNVSVSYLLGEEKEKPPNGEQVSEARKQLYTALDDMSDEELLFLMSKIKAIKEMRE